MDLRIFPDAVVDSGSEVVGVSGVVHVSWQSVVDGRRSTKYPLVGATTVKVGWGVLNGQVIHLVGEKGKGRAKEVDVSVSFLTDHTGRVGVYSIYTHFITVYNRHVLTYCVQQNHYIQTCIRLYTTQPL